MELLHQVDMVHHELRPDLFKPYTTKYDEQELEAVLNDENCPIFVYDDGQVLGHAFCQISEARGHRLLVDAKTLYIDDICVDEAARGKHVGKALYEYVRDYARAIGCYNITLNVWEGNDAAQSFYRSMGMQVQKTGIRPMDIIIILIVSIIVVAVLAYRIMKLTTERDVQKSNAENYLRQLDTQKAEAEKQQESQKAVYEQQIGALKVSFEQQLQLTKEAHEREIAAMKQMNEEQVKSQLDLIREQMQTTSEKVLKMRQEELGVQNKEQVSKIIDPLQKSLKDMQEALDKTKEQQTEALTRLDETIKINMQKSQEIGETADRLTRALTGEVKVQGNFGELKLKQLLEDLELKEGEQFDTQETLKDKGGKGLKGDDGKGLIPDFILHFPNNRHVVVDSKMSLTDYERYMNAEDGTPEKSAFLKAHIDSVRTA